MAGFDSRMLIIKRQYMPGITRESMGRYNMMTYKKPPSIEQVLSVVEKTGLSYYEFETVYGLSRRTICLVKTGRRDMPKCYWHIFYDFENVAKILKMAIKNTKPKKQKKPINTGVGKKTKFEISELSKLKLDEYRARKNN